jgi:hypothetical protein
MAVNAAYQRDGYVPVLYISGLLEDEIEAFATNDRLAAKPAIALGVSSRIFSARQKRSRTKRSWDTSNARARRSLTSVSMGLVLEEPPPCTWLPSCGWIQ